MANFVLLGVIMSLVFGEISAATIQNCKTHTGNQMWIDVDETKASPIICTVSSASKTFSWQVSESGRHYTDIGMCSSSENGDASCESFEDDVNFSLSHLSQSEMTIVANHRKYNNKYVRCVADDPEYVCQIRITHPAQPTQCSLSVLAEGPTVTGSCYIGKTFSSDNTYSCLWYILYPGGVSRERLASVFIRTPYLDEGKEYRRAVCAFSFPFNVGFGMYTFYISFTPGPTGESAGTVTVPSSTQSQQIVPSFTFYSDGYKQMVLDAEASEVAPSPNYTWSGVICNNISAKCIFTPKQEDDNKVVTCMAVFNNARYEGQIVKTRFKLTVLTSTTTQAGTQTTQTTNNDGGPTSTQGEHTESNQNGGNTSGDKSRQTDSGSSVAAIAGGVTGGVVLITIIVIMIVFFVKKRKAQPKMDGGEEVVEHINTLYGPGQDPYEINDIPLPASRHYIAQKQPALDTVDPTYEDHNLNSYDDGYAAVSTGSPQGNGSFPQTHRPSLDHDLYSDVDAPISKPAVAVSGPATQGDEYAVVEKSRKRNTEPTFQPDVYAQVNKSRPKTGGDVYAQVNKPGK